MRSVSRLVLLLLPLMAASARLPEPAPDAAGPSVIDPPARILVAPVSTSIYIGIVRLQMRPFERDGLRYESTYAARVLPMFFYNEKGRLHIDLKEEDLTRLAAGERVHFAGQAENTGGEPRRIEGHADPDDDRSGRIKVRVFVTESVQLIFNSTYRFSDP